MSNNSEKYWLAEILSWLITLVLAALVLAPISLAAVPFPFIVYNLIFVVIGVTFGRYLFFFDKHPLAYSKIFKIVLIFLVPMLFFPILEGLHTFIEFNDREGLQSVLGHLFIDHQRWLMSYIRTEYLFFGIMSFLGSFLLIVKMIRAFWRQYKYNTL